jgi:hypothetical protein
MHETRDCSKEIINVGEGHGKVTSTKKDFWESRSKKRSKDPICNLLYYIGPHMNKLPLISRASSFVPVSAKFINFVEENFPSSMTC